ncbi:MAG: universal stress protein [Alphaproteobacteria bacterium]|jgi:nucleotide-binding universal stress UspA family protein
MFKNILTSIDLSDDASWIKTVPTAVRLCQSSGAHLTILTVIPDFGMSIVSQHFPKDYAESALAETRTKLGVFASEHIPDGVKKSLMVAHGTIYEEIIKAGDEISADLVIVASHRPSLKDYLLGPNAARVVRHFKRSVLVIRE